LAARKRKQADPASMLKLLSICPEKAQYMRQAIMEPIKKPETLCSNEAIAFLLDQNLTKVQYQGTEFYRRNWFKLEIFWRRATPTIF